MKKFLLILMLIIVVPVLGAIAFIKFADFNNYKPQIEKLVKKYADIDVKINGDLAVAVSLKPTIELNDVDISMSNGGAKIAKIGNALVQFSIMPLLHKELMIDSVETTDTHIYYGDDNSSVQINALAADMEGPAEPINLVFNTTIEGIDIDGDGTVSSLQKLQENNFDDIDIDAKVSALGYALNFIGALHNLSENMTAAGEYVLEYKNNKISGNAEATLEGDLPYVKISAASEKINALAWTEKKTALGESWLISSAYAEEYIAGTTLPYSYLKMANADINLDFKKVIIDPQISVQNLKADVSVKNGVFKANIKNADTMGLNINGSVSIDSPKSLPYLKLNIKGNTLDLQKFTSSQPASQKQSYIEWLIPSAEASTLMKNTPIPYQYFKMVNADVNFNLQKLVINPDINLTDIQTNFALKNSVFKANIKNIGAGGGKISGTVGINAKTQNADANLKADNVVLQNLDTTFANPQNSELYIKEGGKITALINVFTGGQNTDQYLANLNGQIIAFADPSVVKIKSLERLQGNIIVQILQNLKLNVTNKEMKLKCAVFRSDIQSGRMNFPKGIVFDAKDLYLVADGHINLGDEKINLAIQPFSGKIKDTSISSILGSLLKIKGTINKPQLAINQAATAQSVIGAIATAGAYNVGDMMLSADASPCHTALEGTAYANHFEAKTTVRSTVSDGYTNTKDAVKNLGKGIGDTAKDIGRGLKGLFK